MVPRTPGHIKEFRQYEHHIRSKRTITWVAKAACSSPFCCNVRDSEFPTSPELRTACRNPPSLASWNYALSLRGNISYAHCPYDRYEAVYFYFPVRFRTRFRLPAGRAIGTSKWRPANAKTSDPVRNAIRDRWAPCPPAGAKCPGVRVNSPVHANTRRRPLGGGDGSPRPPGGTADA